MCVEQPADFRPVEMPLDVGISVPGDFCSRVNTAGGNVSPGSIRQVTGPCHGLWQERVGPHGLGPVAFASVQVRIAGIACRIDDEVGFRFADIIQQQDEAGVIERSARERLKCQFAPAQFSRESLADIAGGSKE